MLNVHTRVSDHFSKPYDQTAEQLRLIIEHMKERQAIELLNSSEHGFLNSAPEPQHLTTRKRPAYAGRPR